MSRRRVGIRRKVVNIVRGIRLDVHGNQMFVMECGHQKRIWTESYVSSVKASNMPKYAFCLECLKEEEKLEKERHEILAPGITPEGAAEILDDLGKILDDDK